MSGVIHATKRAVETIRHRDELRRAFPRSPSDTTACSGVRMTGSVVLGSFSGICAEMYLQADEVSNWPTCQHCLVLLDEALERSGDPL